MTAFQCTSNGVTRVAIDIAKDSPDVMIESPPLGQRRRFKMANTVADYQRLAEQHSKYEAELHRISTATYLSSEDLLEEIKLKKMKLHCKDEMERIALRIQRARAQYSQ